MNHRPAPDHPGMPPLALRRALLQAGLGGPLLALLAGGPRAAAATANATDALDAQDRIRPEHTLAFPRDHGAHPSASIEWWYATGWLQPRDDRGGASAASAPLAATPTAPLFGFQLTFFRSRTGLDAGTDAAATPGRFAPRQLLFAHAAVTDVAGKTHHHAQRVARWSGNETLPEAHALRDTTDVALGRWTLQRQPAGTYQALLAAPEAGFTLDLQLQPTQPLLLQGAAGYSRKGPQPAQASHYYSQPQLAVRGMLTLAGKRRAVTGRGWLDHEWSDSVLERASGGATGWDWIGINLADGGALTAFVLRRADGSVVWAGGSHRPAGGTVQAFLPDEVQFTALRSWSSPATGGRYPVQWRIQTPAGTAELRALLDTQELDSRASAGTVYWEGLAELLDGSDARIGLGYLEMTGRAQPLRLGL